MSGCDGGFGIMFVVFVRGEVGGVCLGREVMGVM